jgi:hypothetical protein
VVAAVVLSVGLGVVGARATTPRRAHARETVAAPHALPKLAPVTSGSPEATVLAAAIAPDGGEVAYVESRGVFVKHLGGSSASARRLVADGTVTSVAFMPDGRSLVVGIGGRLSLVPTDGGPPRAMGAGAGASNATDGAWPSPDGAKLALFRGEVLALAALGRPDATEGELLRTPSGTFVADVAWSPSSRTVAVCLVVRGAGGALVGEITLVDVASGKGRTVLRSPRLLHEVGTIAATFVAENRLLVALAPTRDEEGALREIALVNGDRAGERDVARTGRTGISHLSASRDGRRVSMVRYASQTDAYVGELEGDGAATTLSPLRRVTLSEENERPSDFDAEGRLLVVTDTPHGQRATRVDLASGLGTPLLEDVPWTTWTTAARSGEVLAFALGEDEVEGERSTATVSLVAGGATSRVGRALDRRTAVFGRGRPPPVDAVLHCSERCVLAFRDADGAVRLDEIDAATLARTPRGRAEGVDLAFGAALSPDASRAAIRTPGGDGFAVVGLDGERVGAVRTPEGCVAQFASFAPRGDALVTTLVCAGAAKFEIRRLPLDGGAGKTLATSDIAWFSHPVLSRDGHHLAVSEMPFHGNVWTLEL